MVAEQDPTLVDGFVSLTDFWEYLVSDSIEAKHSKAMP